MEPVTHLFASYTLARAARTRAFSPRMAVFLAAGLAPDLDWFFHLRPPLHELRAYGTATHSLLGAAAVAVIVGAAGWAVGLRGKPSKSDLAALVGASFASAAVHVLLDLCSNTGIEFYWPFRATRVAWNFAASFDAILIALLALSALLPALLSLVTEEIGADRENLPSRAWPLAALLIASLYMGSRAMLHARAEELLGAARYQQYAPRNWAAYPQGVFPLTWRGVVETDAFLAEVEVPVAGGTPFDPRRAALRFKPESSPQLDAAAASDLARAYTSMARFPSASIEQTGDGARAELRELGDSPLHTGGGVWLAIVELDAQSRLSHQELYFLSARTQ